MELRQLKEFLAVLDYRSLSEAARQLSLAQSNLTKSIQALERSVGGVLFLRTKLGMKPTALGEALEARARVIVGEVGRAQRELDDLQNGQSGKVVIGSGLTFAQAILPPVLARFHESHPGIQVTVIEGLFPDVLPGLKTGDIDYGFFAASAMSDSDVTGDSLLRDQPVVIVTRAANPIAAKRRVALEDIWDAPWILPAKPASMRHEFISNFARAGLSPPNAALEFNSHFFAKRILQEGDFLAISTRILVQDEIDRHLLKIVRVPEYTHTVTYNVIFRRHAQITPAAQLLLGEIRKSCAEYCRR